MNALVYFPVVEGFSAAIHIGSHNHFSSFVYESRLVAPLQWPVDPFQLFPPLAETSS